MTAVLDAGEKITPTSEQQEIIDSFEWGGDLVIEAGAGSGKTSTLKLLAAASPGQRGVYIAYNRSIADDASRSFPASVTCKTAHGFAFAAVGRQYAHRLSGPRMPAQRTAQILGLREPVKVGTLNLSPHQLARLAMETVTRWCYSADDTVMWRHVPIVNGLDKPGQRELARYLAPVAQRAWDADLSKVDGQLRYVHDHYLKAWALTRPQLPGDYVLLDEAQDSNGAVAGLVGNQQAQQIAVGDACQAIYGWRGATNYMKNAPGTRLYLSKSFRFGDAIAAEANKWLTLLDAPLRLTGYDSIPSRAEPVDQPDAILCRTNAGAMARVITAMADGRKPALVGGGKEIRRFAEAAQRLQARLGTDHPDLMAFESWAQVQAYVETDGDGSDLRVMVRMVDDHGPDRLMQLVDALVDERQADVVISTAHKAKGREWGTVRIATDFAEPKPRDDGVTRLLVDECMLAYVSVTRAKLVLDRSGLEWIDRYVAGPPALAAEDVEPVPVPVAQVRALAAGPRLGQQDLDDAVGAIVADAFGPAPEQTAYDLDDPWAAGNVAGLILARVDAPPAPEQPEPEVGPSPETAAAMERLRAAVAVAERLEHGTPPALQVGQLVRYRSDPASAFTLTIKAIRASLGVGYVADLGQRDGRIQRSVNVDLLEPVPDGYGPTEAFGWPLAPNCRACTLPYVDCSCRTAPDRRTDEQVYAHA